MSNELELDPGIRVQKVVGLQDNLAMAMKAEHGVRIIAPIPGRNAVGLEIPNTEDHTVRMRPILESPQFRSRSWILPIVLGRDAVGNPLIADLTSMPHLLIAGTTGSGKSVCVNSIILSLMIMRKPHEVKMLLVDPKQVEMTDFKGIPHLLSPVVTDMKLAAGVLTWAVQKMEQRYERMSKVGVRNIATFNKMSREDRLARLTDSDEKPEEYIDAMPYIVIIVDEFADLMMTAGKEIEQAIARLAQKARAAGLHVILATQRPSADGGHRKLDQDELALPHLLPGEEQDRQPHRAGQSRRGQTRRQRRHALHGRRHVGADSREGRVHPGFGDSGHRQSLQGAGRTELLG